MTTDWKLADGQLTDLANAALAKPIVLARMWGVRGVTARNISIIPDTQTFVVRVGLRTVYVGESYADARDFYNTYP